MTNRPYVQLTTENKVKELYKHLEDFLPSLKSIPGIIGITLNGGMSRGYADYLSEIDITLFLNSETYKEWMNSKSPITVGITKIKGILFDVKIVDYYSEKERIWNDTDLWDTSYAKVLFDPDQKITQLFKEKLSEIQSMDKVEGMLFNCWWYFRLAGDIWIHRGDSLQGHMMLNEAVILLVKALFIINKEYIPHEKWLIHMSRSLKWLPFNWDKRLSQAMNTGNLTISSLKNRQAIIKDLWKEIDEYLIDNIYKDLPVHIMQRTFYELLKYLVYKGTITIDEWESKADIGLLNKDPFHNIVEIKDNKIVVDKTKLLNITQKDMYSWHYEIVNSVIEKVIVKK